ncbi:MAG: rhomboid family intramembrane serine protease [Bacteroidota bacterium]
MSVTLLIIIVTCIVSYLCFENRALFDQLKHHPVSEANNKEWYRMVTSGFLHADYIHLGINMYVLYGFGTFIEQVFLAHYGEVFGRTIYLLLYLVMIVLADIPSFVKHKNNYGYSAIGASGAVSGILFIFILLRPWAILELYFFIPIPAIIFGVLYLLYSSWASKNAKDNIGHDAHFFGAVAGMALSIFLIPEILTIFFGQLVNNLPF